MVDSCLLITWCDWLHHTSCQRYSISIYEAMTLQWVYFDFCITSDNRKSKDYSCTVPLTTTVKSC